MSKFIKPDHIVIDAIPYLQEIMGSGLIKDLHDGEIICPRCHGTGLAIRNNEYGLSDDPDKKIGRFPYKHQSVVSCPDCYNGILKACSYCGKHLTRHDYQCDCEGTKIERIQKEIDKEKTLFDKSIKLNHDDSITKEMDMLYSEHYGYSEGYFSEWEEFFDNWYGNHEENEVKPTYVWGTTKEQIHVDASNIIENATEDLWEDARDTISQCDIDKLQNFIDKWCEEEVGTTTYYMTNKYSVMIPWDEYEE